MTQHVRGYVRQLVLQTLFQLEENPDRTVLQALNDTLLKNAPETADEEEFAEQPLSERLYEALPAPFKHRQIAEDNAGFLQTLLEGVRAHETSIDEQIEPALHGWKLQRLDTINLIILRLATYELMYEPATEPNIIMNEAIELAKNFNDDQAGKFINGVLESILRQTREA